MRLRDGTNTISDARFEAALEKMSKRHNDQYEMVHNGSGLSEEMPSQLEARQDREVSRLYRARDTLSVAQWLRAYPDTERTHFLVAHEPIDDEIIRGLQDKARLREIAQGQAAKNDMRPEVKLAEQFTYSSQKYWDQLATKAQAQAPAAHEGEVVQQTQQQQQRDQQTQSNTVVLVQHRRHTLSP